MHLSNSTIVALQPALTALQEKTLEHSSAIELARAELESSLGDKPKIVVFKDSDVPLGATSPHSF